MSEPYGGGEYAGVSSCAAGFRLAQTGRGADRRKAGCSLSRPRHRPRCAGAGSVDRAAPDGRDRPRLHRDQRKGDLVILDEPTSSLDLPHRRAIACLHAERGRKGNELHTDLAYSGRNSGPLRPDPGDAGRALRRRAVPRRNSTGRSWWSPWATTEDRRRGNGAAATAPCVKAPASLAQGPRPQPKFSRMRAGT